MPQSVVEPAAAALAAETLAAEAKAGHVCQPVLRLDQCLCRYTQTHAHNHSAAFILVTHTQTLTVLATHTHTQPQQQQQDFGAACSLAFGDVCKLENFCLACVCVWVRGCVGVVSVCWLPT